MKILFLHHQQRRHYTEEPGYNELFQTFIASGLIESYSEFVYQTALRSFLDYEARLNNGALDGDAHFRANEAFFPILQQVVETNRPDLIVYPLTWPSQSIHPYFFSLLKSSFPDLKIFTQMWDYDDENPNILAYDREIIKVSDLVAVSDSYSRVQRIRAGKPPYQDYENVDRVRWLPTQISPDIFRPLELEKKYPVVIFGSSEGQRRNFIEALRERFPDQFHHFGGYMVDDNYLSRNAYVEKINQSKIIVNTQTCHTRVQVKGKLREILSCGGFLLEQKNQESVIYLAGSGVVLFDGMDDLGNKINYYLAHEQERLEIARASHEWLRKTHSPRKYVGDIFKILGFTPAAAPL